MKTFYALPIEEVEAIASLIPIQLHVTNNISNELLVIVY